MSRRIVVVGLGYVGLPLAVAFARHQHVVAYDKDQSRIDELKQGFDRTNSATREELNLADINFTADLGDLRGGDFFIIVVPTPVTADKQPDLSAVSSASRAVGSCLKKGDVVVFESSVYPGATETVSIPILEQESKLVCGVDFTVGYSPERTNYGDREHVLSRCVKVIAAQDPRTQAVIHQVYSKIIDAGLCETDSIKTAEIAKLVENIQRDVNIAFMNEIALIVNAMGLSTAEVLRVAGSKWNFLDFRPGLVGGHCIPVDPYYLIHAAKKNGCSTELMSRARLINDRMHEYLVDRTLELMGRDRRDGLKIGILGITFKGNCPDTRESQSIVLCKKFEQLGFEILVHDPLACPESVWKQHGLRLLPLAEMKDLSAAVVTIPHEQFSALTAASWKELLLPGAPVLDVPGIFDVTDFTDAGISLWQL